MDMSTILPICMSTSLSLTRSNRAHWAFHIPHLGLFFFFFFFSVARLDLY
jgi:hypothetical protein